MVSSHLCALLTRPLGLNEDVRLMSSIFNYPNVTAYLRSSTNGQKSVSVYTKSLSPTIVNLDLSDLLQQFLGDVGGSDGGVVVDPDDQAAFAFDSLDDPFAAGEDSRLDTLVLPVEEMRVIDREVDDRLVVEWRHDEEGLHDPVRDLLGFASFGVTVDEEAVVEFQSDLADGSIAALDEDEALDVCDALMTNPFALEVLEHVGLVANCACGEPLQSIFWHLHQ